MDVPEITLGGRKFPVPEFPIKEQRKFVPLLTKVSDLGIAVGTEEGFGVLVDFLHQIVSRDAATASPISKDEFEGLTIKLLQEVKPALEMIAKQMGMEKPKAGEE